MHDLNAGLVYEDAEIERDWSSLVRLAHSVRSLKWFRGIMCDSSKSVAVSIYITIF